jgi:hypothetical protein
MTNYLENGNFNITKAWFPTDKQREIEKFSATQRLLVGGIRSGKTAGAIMHDIQHGLLRYPKSNMLVLRRTFPELKSGPIEDFREHCPPESYTYHQTNHVATFVNGSRLVFGYCRNGKEEDARQYLGTAYPYVVCDECSQFSQEAWWLLLSRNTINPECEPDSSSPCGGCGNPAKCGYPCLPVPHITGCTNPFGDYWLWYKSMFISHEPFEAPEDCKRDKNGRYWQLNWDGSVSDTLIYNPSDYQAIHSTVLDNPHALKKDPGIIDRLNKLPGHLRDLYLLGYMDGGSGQYFQGGFTEDNVVDLKADPDAIVWEPWQPVFGGWDWALGGHWNACYFFTQAQVKVKIADKGEFRYDYKRKIVCFQEFVTQGKAAREMANWIASTLRYPNGEKISKVHWIAFSHEKFARQVEEHSPADIVSQEMVAVGLCPVSRGTTNRIGRATLMYQKLLHREVVILKQCDGIISAIPNLMSDPDTPLDVIKPKGASRIDDCYDGFSLGLYGFFNPQDMPREMKLQEKLDSMAPLDRHFEKWRNTIRIQNRQTVSNRRQLWMERLKK